MAHDQGGQGVYDIENQGYSVLYKGPSGTGKTHNILTWPGKITLACLDKNMRTLRTAMKGGADVDPVLIGDWNTFANSFVPDVANRKFPPGTIAVDTLDPLGILMQRDVQGSRARLTQSDFGTILNRWIDTMGQLVDATINKGEGTPYYNLVCSVHLKDVTNEGGALLKITPALMGAFKDQLENFFDWVLLCEAEVSSTTVSGKPQYTKKYRVRTVPPTKYHTCKGGGLPAIVGGTYKELMANETD